MAQFGSINLSRDKKIFFSRSLSLSVFLGAQPMTRKRSQENPFASRIPARAEDGENNKRKSLDLIADEFLSKQTKEMHQKSLHSIDSFYYLKCDE